MSEKRIQGLEARRLAYVKKARKRRASKFLAMTGMDAASTCHFTGKACPKARSCAFSAAEAFRKDELCSSGRPSISRWSMCRTAIEGQSCTEGCQHCARHSKCNAKNGFRLFRCFRLARKGDGPLP